MEHLQVSNEVSVNYYNCLGDFFVESCNKYLTSVCYQSYQGKQKVDRTYQELYRTAISVGRILNENFPKGTHIALLGETNFIWLSSMWGMLCYGMPIVPLDRYQNKSLLVNQVNFADITVLLYSKKYEKTAQYIKEVSKCCKSIICMESLETECGMIQCVEKQWDECMHSNSISPSDTAFLVFTSGTTGLGKCVELTHKNLLCVVYASINTYHLDVGDVLLSMLPNNHMFGIVAELLAPIFYGTSIAVCDNVLMIQQCLSKFQPKIMIVVPAIAEMVKKLVVSYMNRLKQEDLELVSCSRAVLGEKLKYIICGGAPCEAAISHFFDDLGIHFLEVYGTTECSPFITMNTVQDLNIDSVGKVISGCNVKLVDGEVWVSGDNVMKGYYNNKAVTETVLKEGWYKTGDKGYFDENGFLHLNGRKSNMIVLKNGENIYPEELEGYIKSLETVEEVLVYKDNELLVAQIYPVQNDINEELYKIIKIQIDEINSRLPKFKHIQILKLRNSPFEKTKTMKIKRRMYVDN